MKSLAELDVAIVGLGLMGGSMALSLRPYVNRIIAVDTDAGTLALAARRGIVEEATHELGKGLLGADLVILATPVREIIRIVTELPGLRPDGCAVIDLGSTKTLISLAMDRLPDVFLAIGGHPMCGREVSGLGAATADMYQGQTFVLCPNRRTGADLENLALAILGVIGAHPLFLSPAAHDLLAAGVSHLPYAIAALLAQRATALARQDHRIWQVAASGFRDTTRVAGTDPRVMGDILTTNRGEILRQLRHYQDELNELVELLSESDDASLYDWLAETRRSYLEFLEQTQGR